VDGPAGPPLLRSRPSSPPHIYTWMLAPASPLPVNARTAGRMPLAGWASLQAADRRCRHDAAISPQRAGPRSIGADGTRLRPGGPIPLVASDDGAALRFAARGGGPGPSIIAAAARLPLGAAPLADLPVDRPRQRRRPNSAAPRCGSCRIPGRSGLGRYPGDERLARIRDHVPNVASRRLRERRLGACGMGRGEAATRSGRPGADDAVPNQERNLSGGGQRVMRAGAARPLAGRPVTLGGTRDGCRPRGWSGRRPIAPHRPPTDGDPHLRAGDRRRGRPGDGRRVGGR
jgi:hypothetical protein